MQKIFALVLFLIFISASGAFASSIEIIPLLERQGKNDTALLIGVSEEQKAEFISEGLLTGTARLLSQTLKFMFQELSAAAG